MRIDLHCHSKHSKRPALWLMRKLGCPESFTEPDELYHLCLSRGMTAVTITDHNVIDGCLDIAGKANTFVSCEYTTYFPEDRCKVHVLAYGLTEAQHALCSQARANIFDLVHLLQDERIPHVCAHPLYSPNDRLTLEHVEKLLLLFKNWERNGDVDPAMNAAVREILANLTPELLERLANKHDYQPRFPEPWRKTLTAGSDDHSSLHLASSYTEAPAATTLGEFWRCLADGHVKTHCRAAQPEGYARNVYGIAYQFYKSRLNLGRYVDKDLFLRFLDRCLWTRPDPDDPYLSRLYMMVSRRRQRRKDANGSLFAMARKEADKLIRNDPALMDIVRTGQTGGADLDAQWFRFVHEATNKVMLQFGGHVVDRVLKAHIFDLFHAAGSAGALYALLAPYFVSFSVYASQRRWSRDAAAHLRAAQGAAAPPPAARVAHFTDTFFDINGVARTLRQQLATGRRLGKDYAVIASFPQAAEEPPGLVRFEPVGQVDLPEYPGLQVLFPPFLRMLRHCYRENYTHFHISTPGPVGVAALGIARILGLPISGTYHTAFPQYARRLTDDTYVEDLAWRCMMGFYDQLDSVYVPSRATGAELVERGLDPGKVIVYPRGVDIGRFHPGKRSDIFRTRFGLSGSMANMLYSGRVSQEKSLDVLADAYLRLLESGVNARLVIVGDGPYRQEMIRRLEGTPAFFTGYLEGEELSQAYASSDLLVFPSGTDTFGNVVLEAQAAGIPAIVTDKGGPQENVRPGETGLVVPAGDQEALTRAMAELVTDSGRRREMGRAARAFMEQRGFEDAFQKLWALYVSEEPRPDRQGGLEEMANRLGAAPLAM